MGPTLTPLLSAQQSTVTLPGKVMRAAAHPFSLSSSFTCPILACNQPLGIPIRYSQSPSFQPICVTTNACGEASRVSLKSLVVFLFMLLLPRLISSSRQGGISHWHRWSESVWYPTQPMWTHLSAETHWTNFKEKDGKSQLFALFFEIECLGLPWLQHKKFFKNKKCRHGADWALCYTVSCK